MSAGRELVIFMFGVGIGFIAADVLTNGVPLPPGRRANPALPGSSPANRVEPPEQLRKMLERLQARGYEVLEKQSDAALQYFVRSSAGSKPVPVASGTHDGWNQNKEAIDALFRVSSPPAPGVYP